MSIEIIETLNQRIVIELPCLTREDIHAALEPFVGRLVNIELHNEMRDAIKAMMVPRVTIESLTPPSRLLIHLPLYQHVSAERQVRALKVAAVIPNPRGIELHFQNTRYAPVQVSNRWANDWTPAQGGYYGHAENGEPFYHTAEFFDSLYTMVEVGA